MTIAVAAAMENIIGRHEIRFKRRFAAQIAFIRRGFTGALTTGALTTMAEHVQAMSRNFFMRTGTHIIDWFARLIRTHTLSSIINLLR